MDKSDIKRLMTILLSINVTLASCLSTYTVKAQTIDDNIKTYQDYFDDEVKYNDNKNYLSDEKIDKLIKFNEYKPNYNYKFDGNVNNIINNIKNNSNNNMSEDFTSIFNTEFSNDVNTLLTKILNDIKINATNDIKSDFSTLSKLKIMAYRQVNSPNFNEYNKKENTMYINIGSLKNEEDLEYVLNFMVNSVRANEYFISKDYTLNYEDNYDTLLYGASIDSEIDVNKNINLRNESLEVAKEYQGELLLLNIANKDNKCIDKYYNAIFDSNLKDLFSVLNLKDKKDIEHFYKILYAMDAKLYNNSYVDKFIENYVNNNDKKSLNEFIGYDYKLDLYERSVNNLFEYQKSNKDISVQEMLVLYNIITNAVINDVNDINFIKTIKELDDKYIEYMAKYYKLEVEQVRLVEHYNVRYIMINMASITHKSDQVIDEYMEESNRLLEKYPLTKIITSTNYIYETQKEKAFENIKDNTIIKR